LTVDPPLKLFLGGGSSHERGKVGEDYETIFDIGGVVQESQYFELIEYFQSNPCIHIVRYW